MRRTVFNFEDEKQENGICQKHYGLASSSLLEFTFQKEHLHPSSLF